MATAFPQYFAGLPTKDPQSSARCLPSVRRRPWSFWLGYFQSTTGSGVTGNFIGFSADPTDPFDVNYAATGGTATGAAKYQSARIPAFFDFQISRVSNYQYFPDNGIAASPSVNSPYLYFAPVNGAYPSTYMCANGNVTCTPYVDTRQSSASPPPVNPKSFQILCPGMDGVYGPGNSYPTGARCGGRKPYTKANYDDITNFTSKSTLQDDMSD